MVRQTKTAYERQAVSVAGSVGLDHTWGMGHFRTPQVVLFTRDIDRATAFYGALGFREVFRTPEAGTPIHVDLALDGYRLGLATESSTRKDHGLSPVADGQRAAVILWTDDVPAGYDRLIGFGAKSIKAPSPWLDRLLIAWVEDPDGHLVQIVQHHVQPQDTVHSPTR